MFIDESIRYSNVFIVTQAEWCQQGLSQYEEPFWDGGEPEAIVR